MPAPSRKALTGNSPGWRHRNWLQDLGSPQFRNPCTAEGSNGLAQQGQHTTLLAGTWFIRIRGGRQVEAGGTWMRVAGMRGTLGKWGRHEGEKKGLGQRRALKERGGGCGPPKWGKGRESWRRDWVRGVGARSCFKSLGRVGVSGD